MNSKALLGRVLYRTVAGRLLAAASIATALTWSGGAVAQEPAECRSPDPADWPAPSKPYFMIAFDTSTSMIDSTLSTGSSCGFSVFGGNSTRLAHGKCAIRNTVQAFAGQANFGLASYARQMSGCTNGCNNCNFSNFPGNSNGATFPCNFGGPGCGPEPGGGSCIGAPDTGNSGCRQGANILVPLLQDNHWAATPNATNVPELLQWVDNGCANQRELFGEGCTPMNGMLRDMYRYLRDDWTRPGTATTFDTPLETAATGERACRSVNIILVTDGEETCDGSNDAADAAAHLFTGWTAGGIDWSVRTFVIDFGGAGGAQADAIADAGDGPPSSSTTAVQANNETELSQALSTIIAGTINAEVCNNADDNCNGCTDEGSIHYCHDQQTCCNWANTTQRNACLSNFEASIDDDTPNGDPDLLPCTTVAQSNNPATGLCFNPGDICDEADNNCSDGTDENQLKCGDPLACPAPETCNDTDDDCDGVIDNASGSALPYSVCPNNCQPSPEICDGCDNDCDGVADNNAPTFTCGFPSPPHCSGTQTCIPTSVPVGQCTGTGSTLSQCTNDTTRVEICNGEDDNCDGVVDNNVSDVGTSCTPTPSSPVIGECSPGTTICQNGAEVCVGYVGPTPEICDGLDNDCDGDIDEGVTQGVGNPCGNTTGECSPGQTACVGGTIVCTGGTQPDVEVCNGLDDDCDGLTDELPLDDGPPSTGCWTVSGSGCSHVGAVNTVSWDAPSGATCTGAGSLTAPCRAGTLLCQGASGWACLGSFPPSPEACDGRDNDCDGTPDDGVPPAGTTCGTDEGACDFGALVCTAGVETCQGGTGPTPEVCDGLDNDCDGQIDNSVPGVGVVCGTNTGECNQGLTACVDGELVCQGETPAAPELCNGLDDNCDGQIDNALSDAPAEPGCWNIAGNSCSHSNATWDPPAGGACSGLGTLTAPCAAGRLVCQGTQQWVCLGGRLPAAAEICDGIDNDCNGGVDDGNPGGGGPCGTTDVGECEFGNLVCQNGNMVCVGEVKPKPELCDNKDNDCNSQVDDNVPGEGNACGSSTGACAPGQTACVGGILLCQGGMQSSPEVCNGIDDDCNGRVDDGILGDAPPNPACWDIEGASCSYANATWDPPEGGECSGLGSLSTPCSTGQLVCDGVNRWRCSGGQLPIAEVCDGEDNNCDGTVDDGNPGSGGECGTDIGECQTGVQNCVGGVIDCTGNIEPMPEECDGLDNDCDGTIDNGIPLGTACAAPYDRTLYPGDRGGGDCRPGSLVCDSSVQGGQRCEGGVGPSPEICDGKDNDCDGLVDEAGAPPDGVDGTVDPLDDTRKIGDQCGTNVGECRYGRLQCVNAQVICAGGRTASRESCDCTDNDCDGEVDEDEDDAAICGQGLACVTFNGICQCAERCGSSEFPCPTGTQCSVVPLSNDPDVDGRYCVSDPCGDCAAKNITDAVGNLLCAPEGTRGPDGSRLPVCVCKGNDGCRNPCFGVECEAGFRCVATGDFATSCQPEDNCNFFGCPKGRACRAGICVDSPCDPNPCLAAEVCKPTPDFESHRCVDSCAEVECGAAERCLDGECEADCDPACGGGEVCITPGAGSDAGLACGPSQCNGADEAEPTCPDGSYCDPATGACGTQPCAGVVCPGNQLCELGQCRLPPEPPANTGGAGGMMIDGGAAGSSGDGGGGGSGGRLDAGTDAAAAGGGGEGNTAGSGDGTPSDAVFGLATGGGGCACGTVRGRTTTPGALALAGLLLGAFVTRRRQRTAGGAR